MLHLTISFEEKPKTNLPGDNLRYYRLRKRLITRQLAEQIDVVPATNFMCEQNKHPIPYDVANELSKALEVDAGIFHYKCSIFLFGVRVGKPFSDKKRRGEENEDIFFLSSAENRI